MWNVPLKIWDIHSKLCCYINPLCLVCCGISRNITLSGGTWITWLWWETAEHLNVDSNTKCSNSGVSSLGKEKVISIGMTCVMPQLHHGLNWLGGRGQSLPGSQTVHTHEAMTGSVEARHYTTFRPPHGQEGGDTCLSVTRGALQEVLATCSKLWCLVWGTCCPCWDDKAVMITFYLCRPVDIMQQLETRYYQIFSYFLLIRNYILIVNPGKIMNLSDFGRKGHREEILWQLWDSHASLPGVTTM